MRKLIALAIAILPAFAFAQIKNSKHDLLSGGSTNTIFVTGAYSYQTACSFCHQPHHSESTRGLWIRENPTGSGTHYNSTNTTAGTSLPQAISALFDSKRCLSCHDGSIALNEIVNYPATLTGPNLAAGTTSVIGTGTAGMGPGNTMPTTSAGYLPSLEGSHPVSIPYPTAGAIPGYFNTQVGGCAPGIFVCTSGSNQVSLKPNTFYGTATYTVECQSCHDAHRGASGVFLRSVTVGLCNGCHNK